MQVTVQFDIKIMSRTKLIMWKINNLKFQRASLHLNIYKWALFGLGASCDVYFTCM